MKALLAATLLFSWPAAARNHAVPRVPDSATLLFERSNSAAALRQSVIELRRYPHNVTALFVQMEAARLQLNSRLELRAALAILETASRDPRADVAAARVRELAGNTPIFRPALPRIVRVLSSRPNCSRILTEALFTAAAEGVSVPSSPVLTRRLERWQIAGPFGKYSNVDFERSWPAERDHLRSSHYGGIFREEISSDNGLLQLPDYFPRQGVYYSASDFSIPRSGRYCFTVQSEGTYDFQIDGHRVLSHDARFRELSPQALVVVVLERGRHRAELKLQPAAMPLRIWIEAAHAAPAVHGVSDLQKRYVAAVNALQNGEPYPALSFENEKEQSAIFKVLAAEALAQQDAQRARRALDAALRADPHATLADFQIAALDFDSDRFEDEATHLSRALKLAPQYWRAQELKYRLAEHFGWKREQEEALAQRLRLHPDCAALADAASVYADQDDLQRAMQYEQKLATCSNRPSEYWLHLAQSGRHSEALASLRTFLLAHPLDRGALERAVREAVLAGNESAARKYASALREAAPNSPWTARLAANPNTILDARSAASSPGDFYRPYVRDARTFMLPGVDNQADAELLINDAVIRLDKGYAWIYRHLVTQVFDKRGIEDAGEIELPPGAEILAVHTLKQNGAAIEAEVSESKNSISMPGLEIGDATEVSYLQRFTPEILVTSPDNLDFIFSAADKPTRSARLTLIDDGEDSLLWHSAQVEPLLQSINSASAKDGFSAGLRVHSWQASNIPAPPLEPNAPHYERRPMMRWLAINRNDAADLSSRLRDKLIDATRITPRIEEITEQLRQDHCRSGGTPPAAWHSATPVCSSQQLVDAAYEQVTSICNEPQLWPSENITSADDTFQRNAGSRAAALIALLSSLGLTADLELAAELGTQNSQDARVAEPNYTHALVRVTVPGRSQPLLLDPDLEGVGPGALSPQVEGEAALIVSRRNSQKSNAVVPRTTDERSTADADLEMTPSGTLHGTIRIRFGSFRGAQLREALRQLAEKDRANYFERMAAQILPGVLSVSATVKHEEQLAQPVELDLSVTTRSLAGGNASRIDVGQLIPPLGLSRMYATLPARQEDLLIDTPLIEHSEFRLRLPRGMQIAQLPEWFQVKNRFGEYRASFSLHDHTLRILHDFKIPMQVVPSSEYPVFQNFATQIDNFERQSITLEQSPIATSASAAPPRFASELH